MRLCFFIALTVAININAQLGYDSIPSAVLNTLSFRNIGPATTSGRIVDLAVTSNKTTWFIAAAYSGVWKTENAGATFSPIFDNYGTQSIGCLALDPTNESVIWVGTGENNNQRSVGYGNGIYKSTDGGKSFTNMGLKNSEHIGMIKINPNNSQEIWVAAYGPLWKEGGERGVYKSTDGGKTWKQMHKVSDNTGCNEIHIDPRDPNVVYATYHQRRRHEYTYLSGGPESAIYKSTDGGNTWKKLTGGLPGGDLGRISLAVCPAMPDRLYCMIEANEGGMYISNDRGESWEKLNSIYTAGNYYCEIMADLNNPNRVFIMDTYLKWSNDAGKTVTNVGEGNKHVDNHAIWINPSNAKHWLVGCDGGLYQTFDEGKNWQYFDNLPLTQFYRVSLDNSKPFYYVYGGTQDNNTLGGPSRNNSGNGIPNSDWFVTVGGDGFKSQCDPIDPNIVYSQWQYGGLIRYDRKTGEQTDIKPMNAPNEPALRWNWDAPLIISKHNPSRLYFAANKIFKSDDRGNTWKTISNDLSEGIDRNKLPVMGKVWGIDAVAKNQSTSIYGNVYYLSESPLDENMLYAGTDDGSIKLTLDAGKNWSKLSAFPGVQSNCLVSTVFASKYDKNTVFAAVDNHRRGDFKPYLFKSTDAGKTWINISSNLPINGAIKCFAQDYKIKDILMVGTEFGFFISANGGTKWTQWKAGLPPIAIKDIAQQETNDEVVLATFGRGFVVMDNFHAVRDIIKSNLDKEAYIFPTKTAYIYNERNPLGGSGKGFKGSNYYNAPNPDFGVSIYYNLNKEYKTAKQMRKDAESKLAKENKDIPYPSFEQLRTEANEEAPFLIFTITDEKGNEIRKLKAPATKGSGKIVWNLTTAPPHYVGSGSGDNGAFVPEGKYFVGMSVVQNGVITNLTVKQEINCKYLIEPSIKPDANLRLETIAKTNVLIKEIEFAQGLLTEVKTQTEAAQKAIFGLGNLQTVVKLCDSILKINQILNREMNGDGAVAKYEFETSPAISERAYTCYFNLLNSFNAPTSTNLSQLSDAEIMLKKWKDNAEFMKKLHKELIMLLDKNGIPYTSGRGRN